MPARKIHDPENLVKSAIRMPTALHARLMAVSEANGRSMNAEMLERLEASFDNDSAVDDYALESTKKYLDMETRLSALEAIIAEWKKTALNH